MTFGLMLLASVLATAPTVDALESQLAARDAAIDAEWRNVADRTALDGKARAFRSALRRAVGFDEIRRTPLNARTVGSKDYGAFRIEKVILESAPGAFVAALVFLPDAEKYKAPYAGFMFIPGHANEGKAEQTYLQTCELGARNGLAVITYDPLGQGERSQGSGFRSAEEHVRIGAYAVLLGETTATYMIRDAVRVFDYFESRSDIDSGRLGVSGNSGGGTMSSYFMALDDRVKAAAPSCYLSSVREHLLACGPQDAEQNFFDGVGWGFNHAAFVFGANCPVLINAAVEDFFQIEGSRATFRLVRKVADRLGLPSDWYELTEAPGGHGMSKMHRERSVRFLLRHLTGERREVVETETTPFTRADWQVTPTGEVSELPGFVPVYDELAKKFAVRDVTSARAAMKAMPFVRRELSDPACRDVVATLEGDVVRGKPTVLRLGGSRRTNEVMATLFADGKRYVKRPERKGKFSYYERRGDDEVVAVDFYIAGRSLATFRAAEILALAAELEKRTGCKPKLVAEGRYVLPAKFAVAAVGKAFSDVSYVDEPKPWAEALRSRDYLSFADSGTLDSGTDAKVASVSFSKAGYWDVEESPRKVSAFNVGWEFSLDGFKTAKPVTLPHCIDEGEIGFNASGCVNRQQPAWYRKRFDWMRTHTRTFLHFEAIMGKSRIEVNGRRVAEHFGGYLPIHVDVTDVLEEGRNEIVVWCDNSDDPSFPPGLPQRDLDFTYFGGIYRDVWLVETGGTYVADPGAGGVFVDTRLDENGKWTVSADVTLGGDTNRAVVRLFYDGKEVQSPFQPENPTLWSPEAPNLHLLRVDVVRDGRLTDAVGVRFGIRDIDIRRDGFYLNGKKYPKKLIGVNRHQDYLFIGNAMPNSLHWRDVKKFRDAGMTVFRSAHYPQDPAFLDACDELGMFVIDATPGWHFWDDSSPLFGERVYDDIVRMVRRDRSRPSLLMWEPILNETEFPKAFATNALALVHRETRGRGWCTCDSISEGADQFDVNYRAGGDHGKPLFCREWGDFPDDWDAQNSSSRVAVEWGEGPQVAQARHYREEKRFGSLMGILKDPILFGGTMWHGTDHARGFHPDMFFGGILTYGRRKKYSYYMIQSELTERPMVFLAHELAPFSPSTFTIYSNCAYTATWLGKPFVPGRTKFIYDDLQKVVYYPEDEKSVSNGVFVIRFPDGSERRHWPAKRFDHLKLELDTEGLAPVADGSDLVSVTAVLVDANDTPRRYAREEVAFSVEGPAEIVGRNPQETRWGETTVLLRLRTSDRPERITVRAWLTREGAHVRQRGSLSFIPGSVETAVSGSGGRSADGALERIEREQRNFDHKDK